MNTRMTKTLGLAVAAALSLAAALPATAAERAKPSAETARSVAAAIQRLPGPIVGATVELASVTQADFERLQPLSDAALWLPEQQTARFFSSRPFAFAGEGRARVIAPAEDVSKFLERLATDFPDMTGGRWVLMSPVRIEASRPAPAAAAPAPAAAGIQGQPAPGAAAIIFREDFEGTLVGDWNITDNKSGTYQWGRRACSDSHGGTWSGGCFAGGTLGPTTLCTATYPNSYETWMTRSACDSVTGATTATLSAYIQVNSESGRDYLIFGVPVTSGSSTYYGPGFSGNNPGVWQSFSQDLRAWPSVGDLTARSCVGLAVVFSSDSSVTYTKGVMVDDIAIAVSSGGGVTPCTANATTLCLMSRFQVQADWQNYGGTTGSGQAVSMTSDTGYFWFSSAANVEVVAKMVSFCSGSSGNYGIYAGGLTDLYVKLKVLDTQRGTYREYVNPLGTPWSLVRDGPYLCP